MTDSDMSSSDNPYASPAEVSTPQALPEAALVESDPTAPATLPRFASRFGALNRILAMLSAFTVLYKLALGISLVGIAWPLIVGELTYFVSYGPDDAYDAALIPLSVSLNYYGAIGLITVLALLFLAWAALDIILAVMLWVSGSLLAQGYERGRVWSLRYCVTSGFSLILPGAILIILLLMQAIVFQQGFVIEPSDGLAEGLFYIGGASILMALSSAYALLLRWQLRKPASLDQPIACLRAMAIPNAHGMETGQGASHPNRGGGTSW